MKRKTLISSTLLLLALVSIPLGFGKVFTGKYAPDLEDIPYGDHPRQVFDFWRGDSEGKTPLLVYFHGGGFMAGDKKEIPRALVRSCVDAGFSIISANYPFAPGVHLPELFSDAGRAVQFARYSADEYGVDPDKIVVAGGSAGAGIALWLAFHDDLADATNEDPVLRESSRVSSAGVFAAQCSYDPRFYIKNFGVTIEMMPEMLVLYGITPFDMTDDSWRRKFEESSPIELVSTDDPPVFMLYYLPDKPIEECARQEIVHHPKFGYLLREKMKEKGLSCKMTRIQQFNNNHLKAMQDMVRFATNVMAQ